MVGALLTACGLGGGKKPPPEGHALLREYEGRACQLQFFGGWGGYSHPVHPRDPLTWAEALEREGHCQATYCDLPSGRALLDFRGLRYRRTPWQGKLPPALGPGDHFHALPAEPATVDAAPGPALKPLEVMLAAGFVFVHVGAGGQVERAERRDVMDWSAYTYVYSPAGVIQKAIIADADRASTLDL